LAVLFAGASSMVEEEHQELELVAKDV
jgi:hypothetical protein